jgi:hypothetical protein
VCPKFYRSSWKTRTAITCQISLAHSICSKKKENRVIIGQLFCHNKIKYNTLCNTIFKNFLTLFLFITILLDQGGGMGIVGNLRPMPWHPVSAGGKWRKCTDSSFFVSPPVYGLSSCRLADPAKNLTEKWITLSMRCSHVEEQAGMRANHSRTAFSEMLPDMKNRRKMCSGLDSVPTDWHANTTSCVVHLVEHSFRLGTDSVNRGGRLSCVHQRLISGKRIPKTVLPRLQKHVIK